MKQNRREFLKTTIVGTFLAVILAKISWVSSAFAASFRSPAPANAADPAKPGPAMAQKYVHFVADYKGVRKATFTADAKCKNCSFFKPDKKGDAWGKCAMVGNKYAYEEGLCQAWAKKAGA